VLKTITHSLITVGVKYLWKKNTNVKRQFRSILNRSGGVMVKMLASSAVDRGFEPRSAQTKDYNIGICCFSAKHTALRRKNEDWLVRNRDNVSEWGDMSIRGLLFHRASAIKIQLFTKCVGLDLISISLNTYFHHDIAEKLMSWS
jgi:hypothetical protein